MKLWNRSKPGEIMQLYGVLIALGLILYFLLMYVFGLADVTGLRYLNIVFMLVGVYYALKQFQRTHDGHLNYFRALTLGTAASVIATVIFTVFIFIFFQVEGNLMKTIQEKEPLGGYLNPYMVAFLILIEGIISGFSVAYLFGNIMQTDKATEPQGGEIPTVDWGDSKVKEAKYKVHESHG